MASFRKRGNKWQVQVRRMGCVPISRTFNKKSDGQRWANDMEARADVRDLPTNTRELDELTVADILKRYRDEIVSETRPVYP